MLERNGRGMTRSATPFQKMALVTLCLLVDLAVAFKPTAPGLTFPAAGAVRARVVGSQTGRLPPRKGPPDGSPLPPLKLTFAQRAVDKLFDAIFPLLYFFEQEGMLDTHKNQRVLWVRALLAAAGELDDDVAAQLLPSATRWLVSAPLARTIWSPVLPQLGWPGIMSYGVKYRTEFIDDVFGAFLDANAELEAQVVVIGAGYDTRALRYVDAGMRFYEVDLPEVTGLKARMVERFRREAGEGNGSSVLAGSLGVDLNEASLEPPGVFAQLEALGLKKRRPTLVVIEAVLLYVSPAAKHALLDDAAAFINANEGSAVVLADNLSPFVSTNSADDATAFLSTLGLALQQYNSLFGGVIQFVHATGAATSREALPSSTQ